MASLNGKLLKGKKKLRKAYRAKKQRERLVCHSGMKKKKMKGK